ncbi:MAG: hypothetical protein HY235_03845 [Acidobacteria bacterium]|nr:hypothetical protein [Acidobacteriota bacterium]
MAEIINSPGESVAGRYGPDQSGVISAAAFRTSREGSASGALALTFATAALPNARYDRLGNLDRILVTSGHSGPGAQGIDWTGDRKPRFSGGDDNTKYRIALDFTQPLLDKLGRTVPMNDWGRALSASRRNSKTAASSHRIPGRATRCSRWASSGT